MTLREQLGDEWYQLLAPVFEEKWMETLGKRLGAVQWLRPNINQIFQAYKLCQPSKLKVLIIGQDPYPHKSANGLAFSTTEPELTLTLRIINRELERSGYGKLPTGDLTFWAEQGVMLLNTVLTCEQGNSLAHKGWGWEKFVSITLEHISKLDQPIVVMMWGNHAKELVTQKLAWDKANFHTLTACHPVAESYSEGRIRFVGCNHFLEANRWLINQGGETVNWTNIPWADLIQATTFYDLVEKGKKLYNEAKARR